MGNDQSKKKQKQRSKSSPTPKATTPNSKSKKSVKTNFKTCKKIGKIPFDDIVGHPIQTNDGIIFLSQKRMTQQEYEQMKQQQAKQEEEEDNQTNDEENNDTDNKDDDNENKQDIDEDLEPPAIPANEKSIKLNVYKFDSNELSKCIEIDSTNYLINIEKSVYTKHPKNDSNLYIINKNSQLLTISIEDSPKITKITDINAGNTVCEAPVDPKNFANISVYNDQLIILGAIQQQVITIYIYTFSYLEHVVHTIENNYRMMIQRAMKILYIFHMI